MILVTGAAGKTGRAVLLCLSEKEEPVRALVHHSEQKEIVSSLGVQEVVVGNMKSVSTMERAMQGVRAVYHICPNVSPDEAAIGQAAIAAARNVGVEQFVFHSVLKPGTEAMPHHWNKLRVEEQLIQSGLTYTILQPAAYMENILGHWESIINKGVFPVPYPADTRLSLVDLQDVAQVAAKVLTESGHNFAIYELVGVEGLSQTELAHILSQELRRPVKISLLPLETWQDQARERGLGDYQVETLLRMFHFYHHYNFLGNPHVLSWLLNRPPNSFTDFVKRTIQERVDI
jgi:uncharacterized protein YbjT (DUF2867 family)